MAGGAADRSRGGNSHQRNVQQTKRQKEAEQLAQMVVERLPAPAVPPRPESRTGWQKVLDVVEQPFVLTAIAVLAALVDLISHAPVLLLCGVLVLLGFHRSKVLAGKTWRVQVPSYVALFLCVSTILYGVHMLLKRTTSEFFDDIVAKVVKALPPNATPLPQNANKRKYPAFREKTGDEFKVMLGGNTLFYSRQELSRAKVQLREFQLGAMVMPVYVYLKDDIFFADAPIYAGIPAL